jgi:Spy/CpxP family protein refolding chaperone
MIRKYGLLILIGLLGAALLASEAQAQPGGGGGQRGGGRMGGGRGMGGGGMAILQLLQDERVQKELEIVADQKTKITELADEQRNAMRDAFSSLSQDLTQEERTTKMQQLMKENQDKLMKKLGEILLPKQLERLKQLLLQAQGAAALEDADVVKALNITTEQQDKIRTIREEARQKMRDALQDLSGAERRTKQQEMQKELNDKVLAVLTADQAAQLEKMKGPKADYDVSSILTTGRGGRGQGGGGQGGGGQGGGGQGGGGRGGRGGRGGGGGGGGN